MIVWLTGQPGAGKTTIARKLGVLLSRDQLSVAYVDGDDMREIMPNPGYDETGRRRNIDRAQAVAAYTDSQADVVIVSLVSPYLDQRESFKASHNVSEIYVHTSQIRGKEKYHVAEYEPPTERYVDIDTTVETSDESGRRVHRSLAAVPLRA